MASGVFVLVTRHTVTVVMETVGYKNMRLLQVVNLFIQCMHINIWNKRIASGCLQYLLLNNKYIY